MDKLFAADHTRLRVANLFGAYSDWGPRLEVLTEMITVILEVFEVFGAVVCSVAIDVVYSRGQFYRPPKNSLHDNDMLTHPALNRPVVKRVVNFHVAFGDNRAPCPLSLVVRRLPLGRVVVAL